MPISAAKANSPVTIQATVKVTKVAINRQLRAFIIVLTCDSTGFCSYLDSFPIVLLGYIIKKIHICHNPLPLYTVVDGTFIPFSPFKFYKFSKGFIVANLRNSIVYFLP